jgi:hypothetical protein
VLWMALHRDAEAETLFRDTLRLRRDALGPRHPDTLVSMNNLAWLMKVGGRYAEAEPLYREALRGEREVLGPSHPDTLTLELNLVLLMAAEGKFADAVALQALSCPRFFWTAICLTGGSNGEVQHEQNRTRGCGWWACGQRGRA